MTVNSYHKQHKEVGQVRFRPLLKADFSPRACWTTKILVQVPVSLILLHTKQMTVD